MNIYLRLLLIISIIIQVLLSSVDGEQGDKEVSQNPNDDDEITMLVKYSPKTVTTKADTTPTEGLSTIYNTSVASTPTSELPLPTTTEEEVVVYEACELNHCNGCIRKPGVCVACVSGYFLSDNNRCAACPENCTACNTDYCLQCIDGMFVDSGPNGTTTCQSCRTPSCKHCLDNQTCIACGKGYYLTGSKCKACQRDNCDRCHVTDTGTDCDDCADGYLLVRGIACVKGCEENCMACELKLEIQSVICVACHEGFHVNEGGKCTACPADCMACSSGELCLQCNIGYYVDQNGICTACEAGSRCSSCVRARPVCGLCRDMYQLSEDPHDGCRRDTSHNCFSCSKECGSSVYQRNNNITTAYCDDLGESASCMSYRIMDAIIKRKHNKTEPWINSLIALQTVQFTFGCQKIDCKADNSQQCQYDDIKRRVVCSTCCNTMNCNSHSPPGISLMAKTDNEEVYRPLIKKEPVSSGAYGISNICVRMKYLGLIYIVRLV